MLAVGAVILRRTSATVDAMRGLDRDERKAVGRAVTRGATVDDPRLAGAAVLLAEQQLNPMPGPEWMKNGLPFILMGAFLLVTAVIGGRPSSAVIGLGMAGAGVLTRWARGRVRNGLEANRRLLDA